jgi:hypothetical protein
MARLAAILKALATAFRRDWKSFGSLGANNLLWVTLFLLQKAGTFIYLIVGLVMLVPMSADPLRKIPPSRLALWPLSRVERGLLRALSPWVNPVSWLVAALAVWALHGRVTAGLWALAAGLFAGGFALSSLPLPHGFGMWRRLPHFPGPLDQLLRKNLREILSTLDFYCALLLAVSLLVYRLLRLPLPPEAFLAMTLLIVLALSTYTQSLFGLDGEGGLSRYRLLPLTGWQLLAAKDGAFLAATVVLTLPAAPSAGLAAALMVLATGHAPSVDQPSPQIRWRFTTGHSVVYGFFQAGLMGVAGSAVFFLGPLLLIPCVAIWAGTLWWYGRRLGTL